MKSDRDCIIIVSNQNEIVPQFDPSILGTYLCAIHFTNVRELLSISALIRFMRCRVFYVKAFYY